MKELNLTQGSVPKVLLQFAVPFLIANVLQALYGGADLFVVGQYDDSASVAAVAIGSQVMQTITGIILGITTGTTVLIAIAIGAKDDRKVAFTIGSSVWLFSIVGVLLTLVMLAFHGQITELMHTPAEAMADTKNYILVCSAGILFIIGYNVVCGILRGLGDSKTPLYFVGLACIINIVLDFILVGYFHWGATGAAIATVFSQLVSGLLNLYWIVRKTGLLTNSKNMLAFSFEHIKKLCIISFPMGFEYSISAIGAVIMQGAINSFGSVVIAGQTSGEKIRQMFTLPMESVGMGIATYAGQNLGAKRYDRIKEGLRAGITIQWTYCIFAWVVIFFGKNLFTYMVLGESTSDTALISVEYLSVISIFFFIHGALMIFRNTLQGMGYSLHAVLSGVGELIGRSIGGFIAVATANFLFISIANPMAWGLSLIYCVIMVTHFLKKLEH